MPTAEEVKALRDETGMGLSDCVAELKKRERVATLVAFLGRAQMIKDEQHGDPLAALLEDLLSELLDREEA